MQALDAIIDLCSHDWDADSLALLIALMQLAGQPAAHIMTVRSRFFACYDLFDYLHDCMPRNNCQVADVRSQGSPTVVSRSRRNY